MKKDHSKQEGREDSVRTKEKKEAKRSEEARKDKKKNRGRRDSRCVVRFECMLSQGEEDPLRHCSRES